MSISTLKWPGVGHDGPVLHHLEVLLADHVDVAGGGDEDVAHRRRLGHRHDPVAVHDGFQRPQGVDLQHHHIGAVALGPHGHSPAAPAVAGDHHDLARDHAVGGPDDAVQGGLPGAVAIVEHVLGHGLR